MKHPYVQNIKRLAVECTKAKITPLDLMSWESLVQLRTSVGLHNHVDLDNFSVLRAIDAALLRKANALDALQETDFYTSLATNILEVR